VRHRLGLATRTQISVCKSPFFLQAPQCFCSVRKRFSRDHCCRGRSKPGCRIVGGGNLRPRRPPREYLGEYTSRWKPKIPPADRILMDSGHKARKNSSYNADLGYQAVGPALRILCSSTSTGCQQQNVTSHHSYSYNGRLTESHTWSIGQRRFQ